MSDALLRAESLCLSYGKAPVVEHIDVSIKRGGVLALVGPNGCGKSTLLRALAGLHKPQKGRILLEGRDVSSISTRALARRVAMLAQSSGSVEGMSVEAIVRQGRYPHRPVFGAWRAQDSEAVDKALNLTGMDAFRDRHIDRLSGGQRQRAWIAMTLAQESEILLLDEPTTYLDLGHQIEVMGLLRNLADEGRATVVVVLHDLSQAARYADRIIMMKDGAFIADGTPVEVVTEQTLRDAFGVEACILTDPDTNTPLCLPRHTLAT